MPPLHGRTLHHLPVAANTTRGTDEVSVPQIWVVGECSTAHFGVSTGRRVTNRMTRSNDNGSPELQSLLEAGDGASRESAWKAFVERYNRIVLHTVHSHADGYDDAMDRYAYVLEQLRNDDFARLRRFAGDGRSRLSTWLVVVVRRLCRDFHRARYGRLRAGDSLQGRRAKERHELRRRLVDMAVSEFNIALVPDGSARDPELSLRKRELERAVRSAVEGLDSHAQLIVKLHFYEGMSTREIAEMVQLPSPFQVQRRLRAALASVRESLAEDGVADPRP